MKHPSSLSIILLAAALFAVSSQRSYAEQFSCVAYPASDVIPSEVTAVSHIEGGFVWIGTYEGAVRMDNTRMYRYRANSEDPKSIPSDEIYDIVADTFGNTWLITTKGLAKYNEATDDFKCYNFRARSAAIVEGKCLFAGTDTVCVYNPNRDRFDILATFNDGSPLKVRYVSPWLKGKALLSSRNHTPLVLDIETGKVSRSAMPFRECYSSFVDSKCRFWRNEYNRGVTVYSPEGQILKTYNTKNSGISSDIITSYTERNGKVWLGTDGGGISIIDFDTDEIQVLINDPLDPLSLPGNSIYSLSNAEYDNTVWAGRVHGGVANVRSIKVREYGVSVSGSFGPSPDGVNSMYLSPVDDNVWVCGDGGGIIRLDAATGKMVEYPTTNGLKVMSAVDLPGGKLLLYCYGVGFKSFDKASGRLSDFSFGNIALDIYGEDVPHIFYFAYCNGEIIITDQSAAYLFNPVNRKLEKLSLPAGTADLSYVVPVAGDDHSQYYHNDRYIFSLDVAARSFTTVLDLGEDASVNSIAMDGSGQMWIAGNDGLSFVNIWTGSGDKVNVPTSSPMKAVVCDKNNQVWVASSSSLYCYDPKTEGLIFLDEADGVRHTGFFSFPRVCSTRGNIIFACTGCVTAVGANFRADMVTAPNVRLTGVMCDGKRLDDLTNLSFRYNFDYLEFYFLADEPDLLRTKQYKFRFVHGDKIMEFSPEEPVLEIHTLPAGDYKVFASTLTKNADLAEWKEVAAFSVKSPWYLSWWFFIMLALAIMIAVFVIVDYLYTQNKKEAKMKASSDQMRADVERLDFMSDMVRELRTPLSLINGPLTRMSEILPATDVNYDRVHKMLKQSQRIKGLLNVMLEGSAEINPVSTQFNAWVSEVIESFTDVASVRGIALKYYPDARIGMVNVDSDKCQCILSTFIMSAISVSPDKSVVGIYTELIPESNTVRVCVRDAGPGLKDGDAQKIFQRGAFGKDQAIYGSGYVLAYGLATKMGGTLSASNNPDGGASFCFDLPSKDIGLRPSAGVRSENAPVAAANDEVALMPVTNLAEASILFVEDDSDLQSYLRSEFVDSVKNLYQAANGVEAVKLLKDHDVDIIVSDVMMPEMDGFALCRYVKTTLEISHIPVILLTARSDEDSRLLGYKNGADDYITKPFDMAVLIDSINKLFLSRQAIRTRFVTGNPAPTIQEATFSSADEEFMRKFDQIIDDNISNPELDVMYMVEQFGISRTVMFNKIKQLTGMNLQNYINKRRMEYVIKLMKTTDLALGDIAEQSGFSSPRYFSTSFKNFTGLTPSQYRKQLGKDF